MNQHKVLHIPENDTSSSCIEVDRLLDAAPGILLASLTGVDMDSSA